MNDCTLVISGDAWVTIGGGCRSSGANGSLRYTLRGGRAFAPSGREPVPDEVLAPEEGGPVDAGGGRRLQRDQREHMYRQHGLRSRGPRPDPARSTPFEPSTRRAGRTRTRPSGPAPAG